MDNIFNIAKPVSAVPNSEVSSHIVSAVLLSNSEESSQIT